MKTNMYDLINLVSYVMEKEAEHNNMDTSNVVYFDEEQVLSVIVNVIENMGIEINDN